jgi:dihydrofolate reductase
MGRLIQWNMLSLDGYFEGAKSWDVEWFFPFFNKELEDFSIEQLHRADALLFGRTTYEGMAAAWENAEGEVAQFMNSLPKVVFSTTLARVDWINSRLVMANVEAEVRALKQQNARDLYVFGSGKLSATLLAAGLFDEVRLCMTPLVLGQGATLFGRDLRQTPMKLLEARPLSNGCLILRYEPQVG